MSKFFILIPLFLFGYLPNFDAQEEEYINENNNEKIPLKERIFTGGSGGFGVAGGIMYLEVAPIVGYKITDKWSAGTSFRYVYYGTTGSNASQTSSFKYYGAGIFSRYAFTPSLLGLIEYERLNVQDINPISANYNERVWANVLLIGGGYNMLLGGAFNAQLFLLYDLIDDPNSPYRYNYIFSGPNGLPILYRIGMTIGF